MTSFDRDERTADALRKAAERLGHEAASEDNDRRVDFGQMLEGPFRDGGWIFSDVLKSICDRSLVADPLSDGQIEDLKRVFERSYAWMVDLIISLAEEDEMNEIRDMGGDQ